MEKRTKQWHAFISHASEDKEAVARPLAEWLQRLGLRVWFDEYTLRPGDSLTASIDEGLAKSEFGIVVLSEAFFGKGWPKRELAGLTTRDVEDPGTILPIWYRVRREDVLGFSPPLADKKAVLWDQKTQAKDVALELCSKICPSLLGLLTGRLLMQDRRRNGHTELARLEDLHFGPVRHKKLPDSFWWRTRLVRAALAPVIDWDLEIWIEAFRRDLDPQEELETWERTAAVFSEICLSHDTTSEEQRALFSALLAGILGTDTALKKALSRLPPEIVSSLPDHLDPRSGSPG